MKNFRLVFRMLAPNWMTLIYFELAYKILGYIVVFPLIRYLLSLLPGLSGVTYLAQENLGELLKTPAAVFLAAGILMLAGFNIIFEISAFLLLGESGWHYEKITLIQLFKRSSAMTASLLKPGRVMVFFMLPVLMLSIFSPVSVYLKAVRIPEFILDFLWGNGALYGALIGMLAISHILLLLYIFGLPAMLFGERSFCASWHESLDLLRGRKIKTAGEVIVLMGLFFALFFCAVLLFILGLGCYIKILHRGMEGRELLQMRLAIWLRIIVTAGSVLTAAFLCNVVMALYHQCGGETQRETVRKRVGIRHWLWRSAGGILLLISLLLFGETEMGGAVIAAGDANPIIIAHRAGALEAPENTLAALTAAREGGADMAEIDVQQLGDGTLVVMHDTNFKRTAGIDLDVWDADYGMVQGLNAGAYFYQNGTWEPVPALEEFLKAACGTMGLMIELKTTGHETGLAENVLQLIRKYNMQSQCILASMDLDILRTVKELEPGMETAYISAILITSQYDLSFVDGYSVETISLSPEMALQAHFQGKKIYGWTANSSRSIKKILKCGVDGLITDNPLYAAFYMEKYGENLLVNDIAELFYPSEGQAKAPSTARGKP